MTLAYLLTSLVTISAVTTFAFAMGFEPRMMQDWPWTSIFFCIMPFAGTAILRLAKAPAEKA
jgi:hypothetical protein